MNATRTKEKTMTWTKDQLAEKRDFCGTTMTLGEWLAIPEEDRAEIVSEYGKEQRKALAEKKKVARRQTPRSKPRRRLHGIDGIRLGDGSEDDCIG